MMRYQSGNANYDVRVEPEGDHYRVSIADRVYMVMVTQSAPGEITFIVNGQQRHAYLADDGPRRLVAFDDAASDGTTYTLTHDDAPSRSKRAAHSDGNALIATMPGQVIKVLAVEGDPVKRGQPLIVLEAMKMEIKLSAPQDGKVVRLACKVGQIVERGQVLLEVSSEAN